MFKVKVDEKSVVSMLAGYERHLPFAMAKGLTKTGQLVKDEEIKEMKRVFDRPTPFTLNSLKLTPAKKDSLLATVWFKDPPRLGSGQHYIEPQVFGGTRELKRMEKMLKMKHLMPGAGAKLDAYGNISRGQLTQMLSVLKAFNMAGYDMNQTSRSGKRNRKPRDYFAVLKKRGGLLPGIYQRVQSGTGFGAKTKKLLPFGEYQKGRTRGRFASVIRARGVKPILIQGKAPSYKTRFDFHGVAQRTVDKNYKRIFSEVIDEIRRTSR
jgi:hypothetical protein